MTVTMSMTIRLKEVDDPAGTGGESTLSRPSEGVVGTIAALTHQKSSQSSFMMFPDRLAWF